MKVFFSCFFIFLMIAPLSTQAQSVLPDPENPKKTLAFEDIPDEYFLEAENFSRECKTNRYFHQYYNCECLGNAYLNRRIERPDADQGQIILDLRAACLDATEAAGYEYQQCLGNTITPASDQTPEEYCTCFANTYAKNFEATGVALSSKLIVELKAQAHITCSDPALARRFNPSAQPRF